MSGSPNKTAGQDYVDHVKVFRSQDRRWRIEQTRTEIRVYSGGSAGWMLRKVCRSVAELDGWLRELGDPVDDWIED
jgi:hypothetical protein